MGGIFPQKKKRRKVTIKEARELLISEESEKMIDMDSVNSEAIRRAEEDGIIFIDEMDKIIENQPQMAQMFLAKVFKGIFFQLLKVQQLQRSMEMLRQTIFCSLLLARFMFQKLRI